MNDDKDEVPSLEETLLSFSHERVTLRCHGIEQDFIIDDLRKDASSSGKKLLRGAIRSTGAPRRVPLEKA